MPSQLVTRRQFIKSAGLFAAGTVLAACVAPGAPAPAADSAAPAASSGAAPAEAATLRALWVSQTALVEYFQKFTTEIFAPAHNGSTVEFEIAPNPEFPQKILSGIAAGAPPDFFRVVNVEGLTQFALNDVLLPLDDLIARDNFQDYLDTFIPGSVATYSLRGHQYGIPFGAHPSSQFLFYNKTVFTEKGITLDNKAWKWDELVEVARTVADPDNQVFGVWLRANFEGYMVGARSMGGDLIDADGLKSQIATDEAWRFWQLVYDLINVDGIAPQPTDVPDWKPPFAEGKIMMANDNGYRESFLREMVTEFEFDTFLTPNEGTKPRGGLVADSVGIVAAGPNTDLVWEWNKGILATEEGIKRVQEARFIPLPTEAALLAPEAMVSPQYEFYVRQWLAEPPLPAPTAANGRSTEVYSTLQSGLEAAWLQTEPLEAAIARIDSEIQAILDRDPA